MLGSKLTRIVLSLLLCFSFAPTLAYGADAQSGTEENEPLANEISLPSRQICESEARNDGSTEPPFVSKPAVPEPDNPTGCDIPNPDPASDTPEGMGSPLPSSEESVAAERTMANARAAVSFDDTYVANIATTPNYASASGGASGFQYAGSTLYASVFKATSKTAVAQTRVPDDGSFSYVWYACTTQSQTSLSDADIIAGCNESSITLTNDMAGKYLFVKVIAPDGSSAMGPRMSGKPSGRLRGVGQIKAAVPDKTALDDHSYVLIQDADDETSSIWKVDAAPLAAGTSLFANAYDSEASPNRRIADQDGWAYQWLAGDTREAADSAFSPIPGQTGRALVITDELAQELAGKYIRVKVTGDGQTLFGPSSTYNRPGSVGYNTPGPVKGPGQIVIDHVVIACNGTSFGDDYESVPNANVGDVLHAAAYDSSLPSILYRGDQVDFEWQIADDAQGPFSTVATGDAYTVGEHAGKFLRILATARNGVPGNDQHATEAGRILAKGVSTLYDVRVLNASSVRETRGQLTACAYKGDYYSSTPVSEGVTFTWRWTDTRPNYWGEADWHEIPDVHGATFTVPDEFEGLWVSVSAYAGDNTVAAEDFAGPFAKATAPEEPSDPSARQLSAHVGVVGTTKHQAGSPYFLSNWIPETAFKWPEGKRVTAWDAFAELLSENGYFYDTKGGFPYSITTPDGSFTLAMSANAPWSYWAFYVNGEYADTLTCSYALQDGDTISLRYIDANSQLEQAPIELYPGEATVSVPADSWGGFGNGTTGTPTSFATPTTDLEAGWTFDLGAGDRNATWSEPLVIGDRVYIVKGSQLCMVHRTTGKLVASAPLAGTITQGGCRALYTDGKVVVPLSEGKLQAFSASTLHCIWVSDALKDGIITHDDGPVTALTADAAGASLASVSYPSAQQSVSSLYAHDGRIYAMTAVADAMKTYGGWLACIDGSTGERQWTRENTDAGYYWSGASQTKGHILVGGDDGKLEAIPADSADGKATHALGLTAEGSGMRSTVVVDGDYAYCVTRDGVFHKVRVADDGTLSEAGFVKFADSSTSTPTLCDGIAYVGGARADGSGILACIDTDTMACSFASGPNGAPLPADVKSMPLVSKQPSGTFVYFTCNGEPGGVYLFRVGDTEARAIYEPTGSLSGYCLGSLVATPDGRLYYMNDSGHLIELRERVVPGSSAPSSDRMGNDIPLPQMTANSKADMPMLSQMLSTWPAPAASDGIPALTMSGDGAGTPLAQTALPASDSALSADDASHRDINLAYVGLGIGIAGLAVACLIARSVRRTQQNHR